MTLTCFHGSVPTSTRTDPSGFLEQGRRCLLRQGRQLTLVLFGLVGSSWRSPSPLLGRWWGWGHRLRLRLRLWLRFNLYSRLLLFLIVIQIWLSIFFSRNQSTGGGSSRVVKQRQRTNFLKTLLYISFTKVLGWALVAHTFKPSTQEADKSL